MIADDFANSLGFLDITPRQKQVVTHLLNGLTNKQIAKVLEIREGTVKMHLYAIYRRLNVSNRSQVLAKCLFLSTSTFNKTAAYMN